MIFYQELSIYASFNNEITFSSPGELHPRRGDLRAEALGLAERHRLLRVEQRPDSDDFGRVLDLRHDRRRQHLDGRDRLRQLQLHQHAQDPHGFPALNEMTEVVVHFSLSLGRTSGQFQLHPLGTLAVLGGTGEDVALVDRQWGFRS